MLSFFTFFGITLFFSAHAMREHQVVSDDVQNVCMSINRVAPVSYEIQKLNNTVQELKST